MKVNPIPQQHIAALINSRAFFSIGEAKRNRALFVMQICLGPRIHELLNLTVGSVLSKRGELKRKIHFGKTKTGVPRDIDANNPLLIHHLWEWITRLNEIHLLAAEMPLFLSGKPGPPKALSRAQVYRIYTAAFKELRLTNLGTHSPRKTWACATYDFWLKEQSRGRHVDPLVMTQKLGGWKSLESCARYLGFEEWMGRESQYNLYRNINEGL